MGKTRDGGFSNFVSLSFPLEVQYNTEPRDITCKVSRITNCVKGQRLGRFGRAVRVEKMKKGSEQTRSGGDQREKGREMRDQRALNNRRNRRILGVN